MVKHTLRDYLMEEGRKLPYDGSLSGKIHVIWDMGDQVGDNDLFPQ